MCGFMTYVGVWLWCVCWRVGWIGGWMCFWFGLHGSALTTHTPPTKKPTQVEIAGGETVVAKFFPQEEGFPFHEICGNVVGTSLLGPVGMNE